MVRHIVILLACTVLSLSAAAAQPASRPGERPERPGMGMMHARMMQDLKLSDQQKEQMQKLHADFQKKQIATRAKIQTLRVDLRSTAMADNPDRGAIEKIVSNISDLQKQQKMDRIDHLFAVRSILTPDQIKIFKSHMMQIGGGMRDGMRKRVIERRVMQGALPDGGPDDLLGEEMSEMP